jgi:hypothetical protein
MKVIKYELCVKVNQGTDIEPIFVEKLFPIVIGWNEANEAIAQKEAYNGIYTIEDDGQPEPDNSTTDDVLNALLGVE